MADGEDLRRIARGLPGTSANGDGLNVSVGGKALCWPWMERIHPKRPRVPNREVIAVRVANELEKQSLLALDPRVFFTEPHYDGYPAILVRLPAIAPDLLEQLLTDAWRLRATRSAVKAFDASGHDAQ